MNRLTQETSPYLRQHADNPVDWYPWGDEAFARAKAEDKPILLSVGYSACHWCHVMAHESFEDDATAEVMNRLYVNVKVDREERPDVDAIYMEAVQALTGHGGWPMTVFLTPAGEPFYAGTYFPKEDKQGLPGFVRVLEAVADAFHNRRDEVTGHARQLTEAIAKGALSGVSGGDFDPEVADRAVGQLAGAFDARFGGFGTAPKFPQGMALEVLLRAHRRTGDDQALQMATISLDRMAAGGMYDQVGGGFHRYSVDAFWLVPHFEKMLYDQATLTRAYLAGHLATGAAAYRRIVEETVGYVLRDLGHARGGFFSAEDADSEGEEGRFYVWSAEELAEVAGDAYDDVVAYWGVTAGGNFEGSNILHVRRPDLAGPGIDAVKERLLARRAQRVRPGLDDKVLTAWNALFNEPLARAAAAFGRADWMDAARTNARFLLDELRRPDGRVLRSWQDGAGAQHLGYAEDYGALAGALVTLAEVDDVAWLTPAREVLDGLLALFAAPDGSFFTTGSDAPALIARPHDVLDNATPSGNSLAANALLRLAALTGEARYEDAGRAAVAAIGPVMGQHPLAFANTLAALERLQAPPVEIAIVGDPSDPATAALAAEVHGRFLPNAVTVTAAPGTGADVTPLLADRPLVGGRPTAYVCERFACKAPVTDPAELAALL